MLAAIVMSLGPFGCGGGGHHVAPSTPVPTATPAVTGIVSTPTTVASTPTPAESFPIAFAVGPLRDAADGGVSILGANASGDEWTRVFGDTSPGPLGLRLGFADERHGWVIDQRPGDDSRIFSTTDGATSWVDQTVHVPAVDGTLDLRDLVGLSESHAVIVGARVPESHAALDATPLVLVTEDEGATWSPARVTLQPASNRPGTIESVCFVDERRGVAAGSSVVSGPFVIRTADGGRTWDDVTPTMLETGATLSPGGTISSVGCASPRSFWVGGNRLVGSLARPSVLVSEDEGLTWADRSPRLSRSDADALLQLAVVDAVRAWALVGRSLSVLRTNDGGLSWETLSVPPVSSAYISAIDFADAEMGVVVGGELALDASSSALIFVTRDGGATWQRAQASPEGVVSLSDVQLLRASRQATSARYVGGIE